MLGVLAIIGVLSVGGIAGYSRAMLKYKLNLQAENLSYIIQTTIEHANKMPKPDNSGSYNVIYLTKYFFDAGLLPYEANKFGSGGEYIIDNLNNLIWIFNDNSSSAIGYRFDGSYSKEVCRNLLNVAKQYHSEIFQVLTDSGGGDGYYGYYLGDKYCNNNESCLRDITMSDVDILCNQCSSEQSSCRLYIRVHPYN